MLNDSSVQPDIFTIVKIQFQYIIFFSTCQAGGTIQYVFKKRWQKNQKEYRENFLASLNPGGKWI